MKIKITKCTGSGQVWYRNLVGKILNLRYIDSTNANPENGSMLYVTIGNKNGFILVDDCEILA